MLTRMLMHVNAWDRLLASDRLLDGLLPGDWHLSTLVQQVMSVIPEAGVASAACYTRFSNRLNIATKEEPSGSPVWSPDGTNIAFVANDEVKPEVSSYPRSSPEERSTRTPAVPARQVDMPVTVPKCLVSKEMTSKREANMQPFFT